jgi:hypothetical protein
VKAPPQSSKPTSQPIPKALPYGAKYSIFSNYLLPSCHSFSFDPHIAFNLFPKILRPFGLQAQLVGYCFVEGVGRGRMRMLKRTLRSVKWAVVVIVVEVDILRK